MEVLETRWLLNAAPVVTAPSQNYVAENGQLTFQPLAIGINDASASGTSDSLTISATTGTISLGSTAGLTFKSGSNNSSSMTVTGILTNLNEAFYNLQYQPKANTVGPDTLQFSVTDAGDGLSGSAVDSILVVAPPVISTPATASLYEDTVYSFAPGSISLTDVNASGSSDLLTLSAGGLLYLGSTNGVTIVGGFNDTGYVSLEGSLSSLNAAVSNMVLQPDGGYSGTDTLSIKLENQVEGISSATSTTITVIPAVTPAITVPVSGTLYENTSSSFPGTIGLSDPDAYPFYIPNYTPYTDSLSLSVSDGTLTLGSTAGLFFSPDAPTSSITVSGTLANLSAALNGLTYTPNTAYSGSDSLQISLTNGMDKLTGSATVPLTIVTTPIVIAPATASVYENDSLTFASGSINVTNNAASGAPDSLALSVSDGTLTLGSTSGLNFTAGSNNSPSMTVTGTRAQLNSAVNGLVYVPDSNFTGIDPLVMSVEDLGNYLSGSTTLPITVAGPPTISAPASGTAGPSTFLQFLGTISITDLAAVGSSDSVSLSVSNGTLSLGSNFDITVVAGAIDNSSSITITGTLANLNNALDGLIYSPCYNFYGLDTLNISVTNSVDNFSGTAAVSITDYPAPVITASQVEANLDSPYTFASGAITLADLDASGTSDSLYMHASFGTLTLGSTTGLTFTSGQNDDKSMTVTGTLANLNAALDGLVYTQDLEDPQVEIDIEVDLTNNVTNQTDGGNEIVRIIAPLPPSITAPPSASLNENSSLTFSGISISITDALAAAPGNATDTVTLSVGDGALSLGSTNGLTFKSGSNDSPSMTFNGTFANVNAALNGLIYTPSSNFTGSDALQITVSDAGTVTATVPITEYPAPTVAVTDPGGSYNGAPYAATGTVTGVSGIPGSTLEGIGLNFTYYSGTTASGTPLPGAPTNPGAYTVVANFPGSQDYPNTSAQTTFTISPATPTLTVTEPITTYTGNSLPVLATATGVAGAAVNGTFTETYYVGSTTGGSGSSAAPVTAGTYTVVANFTSDDPDYSSTPSAPLTFTISRATLNPWQLDPTFGTNGLATAGLDRSDGMVIQSDGKIVVAGAVGNQFAVARYNSDGSLDTSFGTNGTGVVVLTTLGSNSGAGGVAIDSNGNIVAVGSAYFGTYQDFVVARFNPNGTLDPTFGSGGLVTALFNANDAYDFGNAVAIQSDNEIVIDGIAESGGNQVVALARLLTNGDLDPTFGTGGVVETAVGADSGADCLAIDPNSSTNPANEQIIVGGGTEDVSGNSSALVARYDADGNLDPTFSTSGLFQSAIGSEAWVEGVAVQGDGKVVATGYNDTSYFVLRFNQTNSSGSALDPTFDALGSVPGEFVAPGSEGDVVVIQPDGKIVVGGDNFTTVSIVRLNSDGTLDTTFDPDGTGTITTTIPSANFSTLWGLGIQSDGKLVAAGESSNGTVHNLVLLRYEAAPTVTDAGGTYNGTPYAASGTVAGVNGLPVSALEGVSLTFTYYAGASTSGTPLPGAPSSAGTYTAIGSFPGSLDYAGASSSTTFTITQVQPTVAVSDTSGTFTGNPYSATGTVAGVNGVPVSTLEGVGLTFTYYAGGTATGTPLAGAPTSVGTYTVVAAFAGSTDYIGGSAQTTFTITPVRPHVVATDAGGQYTGNPYPASATSTGVANTLVNGTMTYAYYVGGTATGTASSTPPGTAGTYTVVANFTSGDPNYSNAPSSPVTFSIGAPSPSISVSDAGGTYNGNPYPATGTVAGLNGVPGATLETVGLTFTYYSGTTASGTPLSGAPTNAGTYTVVASFAGSTDYSAGTAQTTFTIGSATPKVVATDPSGQYTGNPFQASTTVTGVGNLSLGGGLYYAYYAGSTATGSASTSAPETVGTYTVVVTFVTGDPNYSTASSAPVTYTISLASPTVSLSDAGGTYSGSPYSATATVAGLNGVAGSTLEGVGLTFTYYAGGTATGTPLAGAPANAGTYTVVASFAGSVDYSAGSAQTTFTIGQATPKVAVTDAGGMYTGSPYSANATVAGVSGTPGSTLEGVGLTYTYYTGNTATGTPLAGAPTNAATYTVVPAFAGSTDYSGNSAQTTFTITLATPKVVATDAGGQFTGNPFPATATATGIGGVSVGGTFTYTYYVGSTASGTGSATAPSAAGTYTVVAAFASSTVNYANAPSGPVTFTITPAPQSVTAPASASVNENTSLVFSSANGNAISVADVNAGSASEQLSLSITNGTLTLAATKGLTITSGKNGSASMTFKGTLTNLNAALNGLKFTPTTAYAGSAPLAIAYKNLSNSKTATANVAVTVAVPASQPTVTIKSMLTTVVPGQPVPLALIVSDTNSLAQSATFTYSMAFGDGATASFSGANQLLVNHVYTHTGTFTVSVTATDEYGHTSTAATTVINVVPVAVEIDPFSSSKTALYVGGTSGNDTVNFALSGSSNIAVTLNGVSEGVYSTSGPLIIFGQGGKDTDKEGSGLKNTVYLLETPNASSAETDLDKEAIQWAGLSAAVKILNE